MMSRRLALVGGCSLLAEAPAAALEPPERIALPVISQGCNRVADPNTVTVCGDRDRRYRIDPTTLQALRSIEHRDDPANRPRPRAITEGCSGVGPMDACGGNLPLSDMALRAIGIAIKALREEDLRPLLRQGPTDYEVYQRAQAEAEASKQRP
ncbi:hypothetical protein [Sphingomonas humi]